MSPLATFGVIMGVYLILVYAMYREILPSIWGLMLMAVLVVAIVLIMRGGGTYMAFYDLLGQGAYRIAPTVFSFMFAGIFARSQIETGIVENIVKRAAELGGDRPFAVVILLGLASAYAGVGAFAGGVFVSHVIAMPILMSLGLSPLTAAIVQGFGANHAIILWAQHWAYFNSFAKVTMADMMPFITIFQPFVTATWIAFVIYTFKTNKLPLRWSVSTKELLKVEKKVPLYALLCPLIPLFFILVLKMSEVMAFIISTVITVIVTQPGSKRKLSEIPALFTRIYLNGINDMSYLIGILVSVGFILRATDFPFVKTVLGESLQSILPSSAFGFILFFGIFMVIGGLFRGPAQPFAMGVAVIASIVNLGKYSLPVTGALVAVLDAFCIVADVTTGTTLYCCALAKVSIIDFFKKVYVAAIIYGVIGITLITLYYRLW